jgi:hypothetical protein
LIAPLDQVRTGYKREAADHRPRRRIGIPTKGVEPMLALIAAILLALYAFDVNPDTPNLLYLGLAFWAAHFAFGLPWPRRWR